MAIPRLPLKTDFPSTLTLDIIPPPSKKAPINILVLLHGLGDTQAPFAQLGRNLNLPETCCLSLRGPSPVPAIFTGSDTPAFHWGDDILFDERRGEIVSDAGFRKSIEVLQELVTGILVTRCQFPSRNILILGFGQGAMAALALASSSTLRDTELGGAISVGGKLSSNSTLPSLKCKTPILLCGGSRSTEVTRTAVDRIKQTFADVEYIKWEKEDDSMPRNREEMLPLMKFFARRLRSRVAIPDDAIEV